MLISLFRSRRYKRYRRDYGQGAFLEDYKTACLHTRKVRDLRSNVATHLRGSLLTSYRNEEKGNKLVSELIQSNPGSQAFYIKVDVALLKNVDNVCAELQRREKCINILFCTAGYMTLKGRTGEVSPVSESNFDDCGADPWTSRLRVLLEVPQI